jgi:hypothetical protein
MHPLGSDELIIFLLSDLFKQAMMNLVKNEEGCLVVSLKTCACPSMGVAILFDSSLLEDLHLSIYGCSTNNG